MKEPMLLKGGIIAGLFRACHAQCCWQCAFWGTGDRVAANQKPHQQPHQSFGNVNLLSQGTAGLPWGLLCCASCSFHRHHLKMTPQALSGPFSEKSSQLGMLHSHPSFPMDGLNWPYSGEFGGTPLISPVERFYCICGAAIAYSYEIHRCLCRRPRFFHVFIRTFS